MTKTKKYSRTLTACYLAFITQAITANLAPLLFLRFHTEFGISLGKIAVIPIVFFVTQITVDVICAGLIKNIGYRMGAVLSEALAGVGLVGLAFLPFVLPDPFVGIIISTVIYAVGSGLIEVLASPIVEACPFENKASVMSILHSFYCWGCVGVILLSTGFFYVFGLDHWRWLPCVWALIPLINIINFAVCPIESLTEDGKEMGAKQLFKTPLFFLGIILMICAGSSEIAMAQSASRKPPETSSVPACSLLQWALAESSTANSEIRWILRHSCSVRVFSAWHVISPHLCRVHPLSV